MYANMSSISIHKRQASETLLAPGAPKHSTAVHTQYLATHNHPSPPGSASMAQPVGGEWNDQVLKVSAILEDSQVLIYGIITYKDGDKAKLSLDVIARMCPLRLGDFCQMLLDPGQPQAKLPQGSWQHKVNCVNALFGAEDGELKCIVEFKNKSSTEASLATAMFLCNEKML